MQLENDLQQKEVLVQRVLVRLLCHTSQRAWSYYTSLQGKECGEKKKTKKPHPQQQIPIAENKQGDKKIVSVVKRVHLKVQFLSKWGNKRSNSGRLNAWNKTKCLMNKRSEEEKHPFLTKSRKKNQQQQAELRKCIAVEPCGFLFALVPTRMGQSSSQSQVLGSVLPWAAAEKQGMTQSW